MHIVHKDCRHYKGNVPCTPHKQHGVHCEGCTYYEKIDKRILIIYFGGIGSVLRTTPILHKLKSLYPNCEITWLTRYPEILPSQVDRPLKMDYQSVIWLQADHFDLLLNLEKSKEAIAIANIVSADEKRGYRMSKGKCAPANDNAVEKHYTGLFDDVNKANTKSYPQELFEVAGYEYGGERYILEKPPVVRSFPQLPGPVIGLNTGCGDVRPTRLWPTTYWAQLAKTLIQKGYHVLLLGGELEHKKNLEISKMSGAHYWGHFPMHEFIHVVDRCDLVVTAVTLATHIVIGLQKKIVLFVNIFNKHEFELYGNGEILQPNLECLGCWKSTFDDKCPVSNCMELISVDQVIESIERQIGGSSERSDALNASSEVIDNETRVFESTPGIK